ncbi:MAG: DNA-binding response regulator [Arcobacter sp.]|nr:MAG: DNA-binding response regulator [Arcobacter sp.]
MKKVLLVEDDLVLQKLISEYLEEYSYLCSAFSNPVEALQTFRDKPDDFTIAILDLGLPNMDGFDLFKKLKQIKDIPIIISTARDDIGNKIYGYELGTDDYLSKPYEPRELVLRIEATLKRYNKAASIKIHDLSIDISSSRVFLNALEIEFTKIEKEIFLLFINNLNKIFSREDIVNQSSLKDDTKNRTVDMHISNIRYKIDDNSKKPKYIKSIWGIGYKFFYDN